NAPFSRVDLLRYMDEKKIGTRLLFAGNLICQPYFKDVTYRISESLKNTDRVMNNTFWLGVFPGLTEEMLDYIVNSMKSFYNG
ncbi:MAG TPA: lipopolysaccharide biosynthesis protein RfbH, partial [Spirochaetes bacterium]|nr:lipopolysaccharide biosynthesis protein RfbH [Spirochaetota bacterium]